MPEPKPPDGRSEFVPAGEQKLGTLGRYEILGELGRGGCGIVYRAMDPSIGRTVAIKTILANMQSSSGLALRERFRREARSAGSLSHPNIVTIHDFNDSGDPMFIAMEFIEGRTLAQSMSGGPLPVEFILGVLRSAAEALDYAHARHIVHRDVKPANFLINISGHLKITDFGIAKVLDSDEDLTSTGMVVGTAQYMSPEQITAANITGRSDQFSLAVIAYEMLTGVKPFQGNSWASVMHAIIMAEPANVSKYRDSLPETVNTVLRKALAKEPEARYATCLEFCNALEHEVIAETVQRTAILEALKRPLPPPPNTQRETPTLETQTIVQGGPTTTREILPPVKKASSLKPVAIVAVAALVILGAWLGLRSKTAPTSAPIVTAKSDVSSPNAPTPPASQPVAQPVAVQGTRAAPVARASRAAAKETAKSEPVRMASPSSSPAPNAQSPVSPSVDAPQPTAVQPVISTPPPTTAPPPAPAPKRAEEDQAKRASDDQAKRAADDQAKRLADEQAKRAADEQLKRQAKEQANSARAADLQAVSRALGGYRTAYERRDLGALQTIWPSIPRSILDEIRRSFREASEVSMDLHPLGDPEISGATATITCDRNLREVIQKQVLQASKRVRIVLNRAGAGWMIQSVSTLN